MTAIIATKKDTASIGLAIAIQALTLRFELPIREKAAEHLVRVGRDDLPIYRSRIYLIRCGNTCCGFAAITTRLRVLWRVTFVLPRP